MATRARHFAFVANNIAMNITSKIVALSSAVAFALQIALALLMLRYFSPEEVGVFSVISQIGFFWTTLALAQTPLRLLANHGASVFDDARQAWVSSLQRFVWLSPVAALAVWWSGLSFVNALLWALLLSLCQLTWLLAQSVRLRMEGVWAQVGVRVLPPLIALLIAIVGVFMQFSGPALLAAALIGYATGAAWLLPALLFSLQKSFLNVVKVSGQTKCTLTPKSSSVSQLAIASEDNRSDSLRMSHALADALLATAIVVMWQRLYGAQETGWMVAPHRVMGFVPSVVHMAWAQVLIAQKHHPRSNPLWVGLLGFAIVAVLGAGCAVALEIGLLGEQWQGVRPYLLPLVLWQGSACIAAAFSHLPFQTQNEKNYSWACIGVVILQANTLFLPFVFKLSLNPIDQITIFSLCSFVGFFGVVCWLRTVYSNTHRQQNL